MGFSRICRCGRAEGRSLSWWRRGSWPGLRSSAV